MMKAIYIPVAQCWRVFAGKTNAQLQDMVLTDINGKRHWESRKEIINDLRPCNLKLNKFNEIVDIND